MRRVGAAIVLMVWLGSAFVIGVSANEGPTIEWYDTTGTVVLAWDGAYTGQTEEVWSDTRWVNEVRLRKSGLTPDGSTIQTEWTQ
jgi:hypothetical protein